MVLRASLDPELRPLVRALRGRIDGLSPMEASKKSGLEVFERDARPFMMLEIRKDHLLVDLWLPEAALHDARASGIARPHPFEPAEAVRVRFDRAVDLPKVARWLEAAHAFAAERAAAPEAAAPAEDVTPPKKAKRKAPSAARAEGAPSAKRSKGAKKRPAATKKGRRVTA